MQLSALILNNQNLFLKIIIMIDIMDRLLAVIIN